MYNLLVRYAGFEPPRGEMTLNRVFEYTDQRLIGQYTEARGPNFQALIQHPALLMAEGQEEEVAYVGRIFAAQTAGREVTFEFVRDDAVPPLTNRLIFESRGEFGVDDFEFHRGHWALKDVDLYRALLRRVRPGRQRPRVFTIAEHETINPLLVSIMAPFDARFADCQAAIRQACEATGMVCRRADDIWEHPEIIQDVVTLIDRSRVVVCDCTGRNANVFNEAGIAHTLGREVILITQTAADIPFDLRHLRFITYLDNNEGRALLAATLEERIRAILAG